MINRTNTVLTVLLVIVVAMSAVVGVDYSRPNFEILPDMKYTPAWEAFAANPNFPDGRTMQPPVPGTIARGQLPLHYAATKEDAIRAGEELTNPASLRAMEAAVAAERDAADANQSLPEKPAPAAEATPTAENVGAEGSRCAGSPCSPTIPPRRSSVAAKSYRRYCVSCPRSAGRRRRNGGATTASHRPLRC